MDSSTGQPRRVSVRNLGVGKWLRLDEISYVDRDGKPRTWEAVQRCAGQRAAVIIACLRPSGKYVLIRQYRPALDGYVLEFPAGLIDAGEAPAACALRELREETGFHGVVRQVSSFVLNSPGMTGEGAFIVRMDIPEDVPANRAPAPRCEDGEHITVFCVAPEEVPAFVAAREKAGDVVDSKVVAFFLGAGVMPGLPGGMVGAAC